jgi:hypothetical protein
MAAEGWKFTVVVPSWTTHRIADESVVVRALLTTVSSLSIRKYRESTAEMGR